MDGRVTVVVAGRTTGRVVAAGGRVTVLGRDGRVTLLSAGRGFTGRVTGRVAAAGGRVTVLLLTGRDGRVTTLLLFPGLRGFAGR